MAAPKDSHAVASFAHFAGETDEQRDAALAALEAELAGSRDEDHAKQVAAEIKRIRPAGKQTR